MCRCFHVRVYKKGSARLSKIDRGDRRLQTRLFRELSKVGLDEMRAPRAATQRKVNIKHVTITRRWQKLPLGQQAGRINQHKKLMRPVSDAI
jgi:hypothetical protein